MLSVFVCALIGVAVRKSLTRLATNSHIKAVPGIEKEDPEKMRWSCLIEELAMDAETNERKNLALLIAGLTHIKLNGFLLDMTVLKELVKRKRCRQEVGAHVSRKQAVTDVINDILGLPFFPDTQRKNFEPFRIEDVQASPPQVSVASPPASSEAVAS